MLLAANRRKPQSPVRVDSASPLTSSFPPQNSPSSEEAPWSYRVRARLNARTTASIALLVRQLTSISYENSHTHAAQGVLPQRAISSGIGAGFRVSCTDENWTGLRRALSSDIAQIFTLLWAETQEELVRASIRPRLPRSTVSYCFQVGGTDTGEYAWNGGAPSILIYRSGNLPRDLQRPDLVTRPIEDVCTLAHERGHFIFDRTQRHSQSAYESFRHGGPLTLAQKTIILGAERQAWQHGHAVLMRLGWTDWASFDAIQWRSLRTYSEGLAQLRP